jgi:hypothetical protein
MEIIKRYLSAYSRFTQRYGSNPRFGFADLRRMFVHPDPSELENVWPNVVHERRVAMFRAAIFDYVMSCLPDLSELEFLSTDSVEGWIRAMDAGPGGSAQIGVGETRACRVGAGQ